MRTRKKTRYPVVRVKGACRGCQRPVPPGRLTWCSDACYERMCPDRVRAAVIRRDRHICAGCRLDIQEAAMAHHRARPEWLDGEAYTAFDARFKAWAATKPPREEHDHIVPFSEGGLTILENLRTLCGKCHKTRTKEWHAARKAPPTKEDV